MQSIYQNQKASDLSSQQRSFICGLYQRLNKRSGWLENLQLRLEKLEKLYATIVIAIANEKHFQCITLAILCCLHQFAVKHNKILTIILYIGYTENSRGAFVSSYVALINIATVRAEPLSTSLMIIDLAEITEFIFPNENISTIDFELKLLYVG